MTPEQMYEQVLALLSSTERKTTAEDVRQAFGLVSRLAEQEVAEAVYLLGEYYYYGVMVSQDEEHAAELYRRAKALGSVHGAMLADAELLGLDRPTTIMELAFQEAGCIPGPSKYLD